VICYPENTFQKETEWNRTNHSDYAISKYGAEWKCGGHQEGLDVIIRVILGPVLNHKKIGTRKWQLLTQKNGLKYYTRHLWLCCRYRCCKMVVAYDAK
jgi:hypothetical protein